MMSTNNTNQSAYELWKEQWLKDIAVVTLPPFEKGLKFGVRITSHWLDVTTDDESFFICDGSGDGGIDIAYLKRADTDTSENDSGIQEGDTWYIIQSKYGSGFAGYNTIRAEGNKVLDTLTGRNNQLSNNSKQLVEKIMQFRSLASEADRIVLVFATEDPIPQQDRGALAEIKFNGRDRLGETMFDVEEISLMTIYEALSEAESPKLSVQINGQFIEYPGFLVGAVALPDLYGFLQSYQQETGNLDQIYEKNVRKFLGGRRRINKGIAETLYNSPEKFGLYNNGITIVASSHSIASNENAVTVTDPYIVNGCQTTRTIWQVLDNKLNSGGTGSDAAVEDWKARARQGGVVTKIVHDEADITNITRYTNSQNAVRQQDFITLERAFQSWAKEMEAEYRIFLEIQRGGIESQKAYEKQHPEESKFVDYVYAFDLMKVYGAGWLAKPGVAFGKNAPFLPSGSVYNEIISVDTDGETSFGVHDLYAAYKIKYEADRIGFGRGSAIPSRRQSRFLFYYIMIDILKNIIRSTPDIIGNQPVTNRIITESVIKLTTSQSEDGRRMLSEAALGVVDDYLRPDSQYSAHNEISFTTIHNADLNAFLKADSLGHEKHSPLLIQLLASSNLAFRMSIPGSQETRQELVAREILSSPLTFTQEE